MSLLLELSPVPPLTGEQLAALDPESSRARENALRNDLQRLRQERPGSGVCADAYNRLSRECAAMGRPLGALREHSPDEAERFFARTVQGPDGHVYWTGGRDFWRNAGKRCKPERWWWQHYTERPLAPTDELGHTCDDKACINPEHHRLVARSEKRIRFPDHRIIGALQVMAMRIGHPPTSIEWRFHRGVPVMESIRSRFGSWEKALHAAGFTDYRSGDGYTVDECLAAIRYVHSRLGRWPYASDFDRHGPELREKGLPSSQSTVYRHIASWPEAVERAKNQSA